MQILNKPKSIGITIVAIISLVLSTDKSNSDESLYRSEISNDPFQELYDQGIAQYLGAFTPSSTEVVRGNIVQHNFESLEGPICYTGKEFNMSTRDGTGEELMIFLQGGGLCAPAACMAIGFATSIPPLGILSTSSENLFSSWDIGYIPYCDGTLFSGDREVDSNGDGNIDRHYRGIKNLSAALDVIVKTYPAPKKILLTGNSAGGIGVHYALPLVRKLYPTTKIELINDSGMTIMNPGTQELLNEEWNSSAFFPASCDSCSGSNGNLNDYFKYQLEQDPNLRMGFISTKRDKMISFNFNGGGEAFEKELIKGIEELQSAFPTRFKSLIAKGNGHTFILKNYNKEIAGIPVKDWIKEMVNESDSWSSLIEKSN